MTSIGRFHHSDACSLEIVFSSNLYRIILIGLPTAIAYGGIFLLTTAPAPITAPFPIVFPERIVTPFPIQTSFPIIVFLDSGECVSGRAEKISLCKV